MERILLVICDSIPHVNNTHWECFPRVNLTWIKTETKHYFGIDLRKEARSTMLSLWLSVKTEDNSWHIARKTGIPMFLMRILHVSLWGFGVLKVRLKLRKFILYLLP